MATPISAEGQIHRLVDMEVQEVSLVDRAANKRRFLVVKRSDGMGTKNASDTAASGDGAPGDATSDSAPPAGADGTGEGDGTLVVACDALEGLTRAVERLQGAGGDAGTVLGDVVQELRAAADLLQEQLGEANTGAADDAADEDAASSGPDAARLDALLTAVGELVSEIRASRSTAKADDDDDEETADPAGTKPGGKVSKTAGAASAAEAVDMKAVHTELKTLTGSLQQHTRRLERLEKRSGVPSSQPAGEQPARAPVAGTLDVSWPLDLNSPRSR